MYWPSIYGVFALVAGIVGFGGIAGPTAWLAEILCVVFGLLAVVGLVDHFWPRQEPPAPPGGDDTLPL